MTESFPLHWPDGWPRTKPGDRQWSLAGGRANTQPWDVVLRRLRREIERIGGRNTILSTNQPLRQDGMPYQQQRNIDDTGAAVYFTRGETPMVMAQDRFELVQDNLRSLALAIEGMRQMERHGGAYMMERAFQGFAALPAPGQTARRPWRRVLQLDTLKPEVPSHAVLVHAESAYRRLARVRHPDAGGSSEKMAELNDAIRQARQELGA